MKEIKGRHIETCKDITNDAGDELIRYYECKNKKLTFKMRDHDVETFNGVVDRWGKRTRQLGKLVDVIKKNEKTLFGQVA